MEDDKPDGWATRMFLALMALLLFGGLTYLGVQLFHQLAPPPVPTYTHR